MILQKEEFKVQFNHVISPDILIDIGEDRADISGTVKVAIDQMLSDFTSNLGFKSVMDRMINKNVDCQSYSLDIKGIALANIFVKDYKLHVKAEYKASKEWWAKPVALIVLGKLLGDFAAKIDNSGIYPGFRLEIKKAMQQLRKDNYAILNLKNLFEDQLFYTNNSEVVLYDFRFIYVKTYSENGNFIIDFLGESKLRKKAR